jgi:hypothetical protein
VTHINQCVANAKRGLSLLEAANYLLVVAQKWLQLDINRLLYAANFSLGLSPALDASRTSMSKLN